MCGRGDEHPTYAPLEHGPLYILRESGARSPKYAPTPQHCFLHLTRMVYWAWGLMGIRKCGPLGSVLALSGLANVCRSSSKGVQTKPPQRQNPLVRLNPVQSKLPSFYCKYRDRDRQINSSRCIFISSFQEWAYTMARRPSSVRLPVCKLLRKSLLLAGKWPDRHQTCTRWSPGKPASRLCSRSRSRSKVTWYAHFLGFLEWATPSLTVWYVHTLRHTKSYGVYTII